MAEKLNPKRITDATRFAQIETAGLYGGYITGLTFSAKEGGVYNGSKLLEKAGGKDSVTLNATGTSDGIGSGELFYIDFVGVGYTGNQAKSGVVEKYGISNLGFGYVANFTYTANSREGKGKGFQFTLIVSKKGDGRIIGISNVISYGEGYEIGEAVPITGGPGTEGFIKIESVIDIPATEIVYQTYAIQQIYATPDSDIPRSDEDEKYRSNYQVGQQITIDPEQWGESTSQLPVTFERLDYSDDVDVVSPGVSLARNSNRGGLYNSVSETEYDMRNYSSPANTEWNSYYTDSSDGMYGFANLSNVKDRKYDTFNVALWYNVGSYILDTELVMHDLTTDLYWMFQFHTWTQGGRGGGFSYTRTLITDTTYAETTFTKTDYGDEVDTFSQYLSLKRGNNKGIYNPNEMDSYGNLGGVTHLWMSEPYDSYYQYAYLTVSFDLTLEQDIAGDWNDYAILLRSNTWMGYRNGLLTSDEADGYSVVRIDERTWRLTKQNVYFSIPNYNVRDLDGLDDKQLEQILKQSLENEIFLFAHLWGLDQRPDTGGYSIQMRDRATQQNTFYSSNWGQGNTAFSYSNVTISFDPILYYKENLYVTFNPDDIDIEYLKENLTIEKINSMPWGNWGDYQMVPWEIIHGANPPYMIDKEMIMLDVQDEKFYRIKFTQWTQGSNGGGFSYTRSDISTTQTIIATVTDITYSLENSFGNPLNNEFSLVILFDKFTKQHFVRVTNEDGTVIDHDFDGNDYTPTQLPEETTYSGYTIEEPVDGVTKVKFDWSNDISSNDRLEVEVDSDIFTIQDQYVENGKLIVELVNDITSFKEFNFTIYAYDKLGNRISDTFSIYKKEENFTGIDLVTSDYKIDVDGDHPYFLDESYHAVIYFPDELYKMFTTEGEYVRFEKNSVITEIGFPFHLRGGPGDSLKDEDVEGGFSLAAKIYHTELGRIDADTVKDNWLLDDDFNPKILDKNSTVTGEVRIGNDEDQRYVYFPIEDFVWDGISNLLIIYYMDGQTDRDGWNGGFKQAYSSSYEEYLGFSKVTEWEGRQSPANGYKAKVNLSFTTNDTRTRS
jgi:hypothetical protein